MRSYSLIAPAKINLYLEILGDRPDGYHELAMILQSIELADKIDLRANGTDTIRINCDHPQVPQNDSNLAYRAAKLMADQFPGVFAKFGGVDITINKQIPVAAGLAGGSTDAAAVLVGVDIMWQLGLTQPELQDLAAQLGSDVPFCLAGGTALATGRGEELSALPSLDSLYVVLAKDRNLMISTAWAYQAYRAEFGHSYVRDTESLESRAHRVHSGPMVHAISHKDGSQIGQLLHNDLEKVVLPTTPQVSRLRDAFHSSGVLGTMMSGSGPTVFALCESEAHAQEIQQKMRAMFPEADLDFWVTRLSNRGIQVVSSVG
ncbi:MAG TPA: 4-(cytidine 5'-diphospho)-2-C-methyl-D-erythritol kinase [Cyanobacteria bacterium UBA8553]|nr:4-(cytidine 5'-diphospho)-2-C-methyl-D-erythritol kinase [Cyanobacteria bacterium UBA8553]HAJ61392.1 4-(cytidine 5'-diphospho)-2-C-methyl-D-erythritol kinase [Cyanobacteria bacterium UBA8543]